MDNKYRKSNPVAKGIVNFMLDLAGIVSTLGNLLDMRFVGTINYKNPVAISVRRYLECQNTKDFRTQTLERMKLLMLKKHLQVIKEYDNNLLLHFRKKIKNIRSEEYFGERLEIQTAYNLIKRNLKFTKTDPPDFTLQFNDAEIFIECTSTHFGKPVVDDKDPKNKIKYRLREKGKKEYCNSETVLFIDITNLVFHDSDEKYLADRSDIRGYLKPKLQKTKFGSLILFWYSMHWNEKQYGHRYLRFDNSRIGFNLKKFLDEYYPLGLESEENYSIPFQG